MCSRCIKEAQKIIPIIKQYGMVNEDDLKIGAFYWVRLVLDPDTHEEWEHDVQPARYAGLNEKGKHAWHCLNLKGKDAWGMRWIGPEIKMEE